jgi:hypothetical protein
MKLLRRATLVLLGTTLGACGSEVLLTSQGGPSVTPDSNRPEDVDDPVAVCEASPLPARPMESIDLRGEQSYDPDGVPLINWRWSLISTPQGSATKLPSGSANLNGMIPDAVGTYAAQLTVTNDRGRQSTPCAVSFDVEPTQSLWIELIWEYENDDLDLHVLRNGSTEAADNCGPDTCELAWGSDSSDLDDPEVLRGDIEGLGPELFGLTEPRDDYYDVYVFDRPTSVRRADNIAIVTVYIDGEEAWSGYKTIIDEGTATPFVRIYWEDGVVEAL